MMLFPDVENLFSDFLKFKGFKIVSTKEKAVWLLRYPIVVVVAGCFTFTKLFALHRKK
jgi:hypothetical protein